MASLQSGTGSSGARVSAHEACSHFIARYSKQLGQIAQTDAFLHERLDAFCRHKRGLPEASKAQRGEASQPGLLHKDARSQHVWYVWPVAAPALPTSTKGQA